MALLIIVYLSFVSLGLPSGVLGSVWPIMRFELQLALEMAGWLGAVVSVGTVVSVLVSNRIVSHLRTGKTITIAIGMASLGLWGYALSSTIEFLIFSSFLLGVGAGLLEAVVNNFVALNYESRHMNWLHSFWGVGASGGPAIMALTLGLGYSYRGGWGALALIQGVLLLVLILTHSLFDITNNERTPKNTMIKINHGVTVNSIDELVIVMVCFFLYALLEGSIGLWTMSYLVEVKFLHATKATLYGSLFFFGITVGRFLSGLVTFRLSNRGLIITGMGCFGLGLILLRFGNLSLVPVALLILGLGGAPIFPSLVYETPRRFSFDQSQRVIGFGMLSSFVGTTLSGPLFGLFAKELGLHRIILVQGIVFAFLLFSLLTFTRGIIPKIE
jgi:fucose permease